LYADDIVLFSSNKSLELSAFTLNNALKQLSISLTTAFEHRAFISRTNAVRT
jgi:hypothetical protein